MTNNHRAGLSAIRKAYINRGVNPDYHHRQVQRLQREWPTMYDAILSVAYPETMRSWEDMDAQPIGTIIAPDHDPRDVANILIRNEHGWINGMGHYLEEDRKLTFRPVMTRVVIYKP